MGSIKPTFLYHGALLLGGSIIGVLNNWLYGRQNIVFGSGTQRQKILENNHIKHAGHMLKNSGANS